MREVGIIEVPFTGEDSLYIIRVVRGHSEKLFPAKEATDKKLHPTSCAIQEHYMFNMRAYFY